MKRCSTSLIIREMQVKSTVRLSERPSSKRTQITNAGEDAGKRKSSYTVSGNVNWYSHCGNQPGGFSKKLKLNYHMTQQFCSWKIPPPQKKKILIQKDTCTLIFIAALFTISINRQMHKEDIVYIHNGILLSHEKYGIFTISKNIDGLGEYYDKWNKSDTIWYHLYGESKK